MLAAGQTINGRYVLHSPIGEGAMGAVWRAEDQTLQRQIAIKFLFVQGARDPKLMIDRFLREARIAASVQHRNVIQTVDFGTVGQVQPFMVMELLSGESLSERFAREPKLSSDQLVHIISLTLRGLGAVHDAGIVHRDLKPQNVFLQRDADAVYPKILDFGISRSLEPGGARPSAISTQEGMIVGTPDYMSPEQARGEAQIDKRSDIYSVGVMLYEGLTGRLPFECTAVGELIVQIVTQEPPCVRELAPDVPQALSDLVAQAMSKNREQRFADARAMRRALLAAAELSMPTGKRSVASLPPVRTEGGAPRPIVTHVVEAQQASARATTAAGAKVQTWGDFEGLGAQSASEPQQAGETRGAPGLELAPFGTTSVTPSATPKSRHSRVSSPVLPALGTAHSVARETSEAREPSASRETSAARDRPAVDRMSQPRSSATARRVADVASESALGLADALDPLYAGAGEAVPDLDYARIHPKPLKSPPAQATRAPAPKRRPMRTRGETSVFTWAPWMLAAIVLVLIGYLVRPRVGSGTASPLAPHSARSPGETGLGPTRPPARTRRMNPGSAPAHLRDVVF